MKKQEGLSLEENKNLSLTIDFLKAQNIDSELVEKYEALERDWKRNIKIYKAMLIASIFLVQIPPAIPWFRKNPTPLLILAGGIVITASYLSRKFRKSNSEFKNLWDEVNPGPEAIEKLKSAQTLTINLPEPQPNQT